MEAKDEKHSCCPPVLKFQCKGQICQGNNKKKDLFAARLATLFKKPTTTPEVEILDPPIYSSTPKPVNYPKPVIPVVSSTRDIEPPQDVHQENVDSGYGSKNDGDFSNIVLSSGLTVRVRKTRMDENWKRPFQQQKDDNANLCWKPIPIDIPPLPLPVYQSKSKPEFFRKPGDEDEEASVVSMSSSSDSVVVISPPQAVQQENIASEYRAKNDDSVAVIPALLPQNIQQGNVDSGYRSKNDGDFSSIVLSSGRTVRVGKTRVDKNWKRPFQQQNDDNANLGWKPIPLDIPTLPLPVCPSKSKPECYQKPGDEEVSVVSVPSSSDSVAFIPLQQVQQEKVNSGFSSGPTTSVDRTRVDENRKRPWRKRENFVSNDPCENADNEDPKWEELKSLRTDDERKRFALKQFGNVEPADPSRNLTFHGFRRKNLLFANHNNNNRVISRKERQRYKVRLDRGQLLPRDHSEVGRKRKACDDLKAESKRLKLDAISSREFEKKHMEIVTQYKQKAVESFTRNRSGHNNKDGDFYKRHLRRSMDETVSFFKYYQDQNSESSNGRKQELEVTECTEMLYCQSVRFYGLNPSVKCKDCSFSENKNVYHPF